MKRLMRVLKRTLKQPKLNLDPYRTLNFRSLRKNLWVIVELAVTLIFSVLFGLTAMDTFALAMFALILSPWFFAFNVKAQAQQEEFFMLTDFLQQFIATFKHHPKIYASLHECKDITQGALHASIDRWIQALEKGGKPSEHADAFVMEWPHFIVGNLVHLMVAVEQFGTFNYSEGLEIIQDDLEDWIEDTYAFKHQQIQTRVRIELLAIASLGIAYFSHAMLFRTDMIESMTFYHHSVVLFLGLIVGTLFMAQKSMATPWMDHREMIWKASS